MARRRAKAGAGCRLGHWLQSLLLAAVVFVSAFGFVVHSCHTQSLPDSVAHWLGCAADQPSVHATKLAPVQGRQVGLAEGRPKSPAGAAAKHPPKKQSKQRSQPPPSPARRSQGRPRPLHGSGRGARVAVVVPFRDREPHLVKFKEWWRWFSNLSSSRAVQLWDIYVVEQFDSELFNRGWLFNAGLAVALRLRAASADVAQLPADDGSALACAAIQDVDYLPLEGVDYADCARPTQLSSEIDRYNWGVPYPKNTGGIVAMSPAHWTRVNGFSNLYSGWGGEDDELYHRLRLSKLLAGTTIRRPKRGHGRFNGQSMHSMNHTKRISDAKAYARNLRLLEEISQAHSEGGHQRWTNDGLNSLKFRIVDYQEDDKDLHKHHMMFHHVKVRPGTQSLDLDQIPLVIPPESVCGGEQWTYMRLGRPVPWDLEALRQRARAVSGAKCGNISLARLNFLLVDLEHNLAKILDDTGPRDLYAYLRSLPDPARHGLIVAYPRARGDIERAFAARGSVWAPPTLMSVCHSPLGKRGETRYNFFKRKTCAGAVWKTVTGANFRAYTSAANGIGLVDLCYATNKTHETQRIVRGGSGCAGEWAGVHWAKERHLYVAPASKTSLQRFCVGSWHGPKGKQASSRILPKGRCDEGPWSHDFDFDPVVPDRSSSAVVLLCVGRLHNGAARISARLRACSHNGSTELGRFPVQKSSKKTEGSAYSLCSHWSAGALESTFCQGRDCCPKAWKREFNFVVPEGKQGPSTPALEDARRRPVCVGRRDQDYIVNLREKCDNEGAKHDFAFWTPSLASIVGAPVGKLPGGLLTLVQEDVSCPSFLCPDTLSQLLE